MLPNFSQNKPDIPTRWWRNPCCGVRIAARDPKKVVNHVHDAWSLRWKTASRVEMFCAPNPKIYIPIRWVENVFENEDVEKTRLEIPTERESGYLQLWADREVLIVAKESWKTRGKDGNLRNLTASINMGSFRKTFDLNSYISWLCYSKKPCQRVMSSTPRDWTKRLEVEFHVQNAVCPLSWFGDERLPSYLKTIGVLSGEFKWLSKQAVAELAGFVWIALEGEAGMIEQDWKPLPSMSMALASWHQKNAEKVNLLGTCHLWKSTTSACMARRNRDVHTEDDRKTTILFKRSQLFDDFVLGRWTWIILNKNNTEHLIWELWRGEFLQVLPSRIQNWRDLKRWTKEWN